MHIEPCSIELKMLISKFIGYVLIYLLNLGVPSAHLLKTFNWYMQGKLSCSPEGMLGSKFIQLVQLSISYPF